MKLIGGKPILAPPRGGKIREVPLPEWVGAGGKALYGYRFAEHGHPNPHKAEQGVKAKVLEPDPVTAPVVKMIFSDYVVGGLSITAILDKLNADLDSHPPPQSPDPKRRSGIIRVGGAAQPEVHRLHGLEPTPAKARGKINPPEKWVWSENPRTRRW